MRSQGSHTRMRQDPQGSANALQLLSLSLSFSVCLLDIHYRDPTIHVDGGKVVQEGEVELDNVSESGVHSIEHYMGTKLVHLGTDMDWLLLWCHS